MDPDDALYALEFIASKRALPVHYNTFSQIRRTPRITWPESKRWACGANSSNQVKA
jgi:L-ascorbate metabolism protein UlaG (beta-lactamase superfamily)